MISRGEKRKALEIKYSKQLGMKTTPEQIVAARRMAAREADKHQPVRNERASSIWLWLRLIGGFTLFALAGWLAPDWFKWGFLGFALIALAIKMEVESNVSA